MALCVVETPAGSYTLREELDAEARELLASRARRDGIADELDDEVVEMLAEEAQNEKACWWFAEAGCVGYDECACGPATLLEVLTHVGDDARSRIIEAHLALMARSWDHYWSGQALLSPDAGELGEACASCLIDGAEHVYDVLDSAEALAVEFGEAVAAFSVQVQIGMLRWDQREKS